MSESSVAGKTIQSAKFEPPSGGSNKGTGWNIAAIVAALVGLLLIAAVIFVWTAKPVTVLTKPATQQLSITGGVVLPVGDNWLMAKGDYQVDARLEGYHPIEESITIGDDADYLFEFDFRKLPGELQIQSTPETLQISVDGGEAQTIESGQALTLEPGLRMLRIEAERYLPAERDIEIEGMGRSQQLEIELAPAWAAVSVNTQPEGATLWVDGESLGQTPLTVDLLQGQRELRFELEGYRDAEEQIDVMAGRAMTLDTLKLKPAPGRLWVRSQPYEASVSRDGEYLGRTPLLVELEPDTAARLHVAKPGYRSVSASKQLASGERDQWQVELEPLKGVVALRVAPADAEVWVDGERRGRGSTQLELLARPHKISVKKAGYQSFVKTVTPTPGRRQSLSVQLLTPEQARLAAIPKRIKTATGQSLVLLEPGRFTMGSGRREQGRRSNETQRDVALTRRFYISTTEVSNADYRQFKASHSSGIVARKTLDNDNFPVVRVGWREATEFCNWLSDQEGLPRAYADGKLLTPVKLGYRLPTEAEWVWAARFAGGEALKYPWGQTMPPPAGAGNYADISAQQMLPETLSNYNDGYIAAAPVGSFRPNRLGIFDLGGNVSEWVNDHDDASFGMMQRAENPIGEGSSQLHVIRGSSWRHGRITELRLAWRDRGVDGADDVGFRVARYAE